MLRVIAVTSENGIVHVPSISVDANSERGQLLALPIGRGDLA
jgi:hypothetical protein